jgi:hypothetical protein
MRSICVLAFLLAIKSAEPLQAEDKPTSLSDARNAVEANLRTPEGKKYDEQLGTEFVQKHMAPLRQCKQSSGDDLRNFWILVKLDRDGTTKEVLLYPETKLGTCARAALLKETFASPPRPAYWVSIYMQMSH